MRRLVILLLVLPAVAPPAQAFDGHGVVSRVADVPGPPRYVLDEGMHVVGLADRPAVRRAVGRRATVLDGRVQSTGRRVTTPSTVRTLGILVDNPGDTSHHITPAGFESALADAPSGPAAFFSAQSGGATRIQASVAPDWVTASTPVSTYDCNTITDTSNSGRTDEALAGAKAQGYDPADYDHIVMYFDDCQGANASGFGMMPGRDSWILTPPAYLLSSVLDHELGHNFGAFHAGTLYCYGPPDQYGVKSRVVFSGDCRTDEYGDPFDAMGFANGPDGLFSTWHRAEIGQLPGSYRTVSSNQTVTLDADNTDGQSLVIVPRTVQYQPTTYWALEIRTPLSPFDAFSAQAPVATGVSVRLVGRFQQHQLAGLVDTHPDTAGYDDAALQPGETFTDPITGEAISVDSVTASVATVTITANPVDAVPPPVPTDLVAARGGTDAVRLDWTPVRDDVAVDTHYDVLRDGTGIGTTTQPTFFVADDDGHPHDYAVRAVDDAGNQSAAAMAHVAYSHDDNPPTAPGDPRVAQDGRVVTISWTASTDDRGVDHYDVYDDTRSGSGHLGPTTATSISYTPTETGRHGYDIVAVDPSGHLAGALVAFTVSDGGAPTPTPSPSPPFSDVPTASPSPTPTAKPTRTPSGTAPQKPTATPRPVRAAALEARARLRRRRLRVIASGGTAPVRVTIQVGRVSFAASSVRLGRRQLRRSAVVIRVTDGAGQSVVERFRIRRKHLRRL